MMASSMLMMIRMTIVCVDDDGDGDDADDDDYKLCVSFNLLGQAFLAPGTGESKSMQKHYQEPSQWVKSH